jgi:ABC-type bacteriocin/lantibiotic exporters, contain an N-terminal double-glycine peptidase domain
MIISSATYFLNLAGNYQETKISVERINKIKNAESEIFGEIHLNSINKIQVKDFSIKYGEKIIINNFNVELEKGKIYAILGANGAGKTTLVNSIVGLYSDLYDGEILFDGISIKKS